VAVRIDKLGGGLTSGNANDVACRTPFDNIGKHDGSNDELGTGIDDILGVGGVEDGAATDHDVAVVLGAAIAQVLQAVGSSEGELDDLEAAVDGGLHGLRTGLGGGGAQDGAGPNLGELVEDGLVVVHGLGPVEAAEGTGGGVEPGGGQPGGGGAGGTEGHGC